MSDIKNKIDDILAKKDKNDDLDSNDKKFRPTIFSPFAKKIYAEIEIYFNKLDGESPTRAVAEKFKNDIDSKLEDGKEKDSMIKYYNHLFRLPGVKVSAYSFFESVDGVKFKKYRRTSISEMRPYIENETLDNIISISDADKKAGSPKIGDMIARNPKNHNDQWLVAKDYFKDNFENI